MDQHSDLDAVVPLASPPPGHVVELLRNWLAAQATFPNLRAALEREPSGDAAAELAGIIDELYDFIEGNRLLLLLIESLADDYPELTGSAVNDRKLAHNERLAAFLASRAAVRGSAPARRSRHRRPFPARDDRLVRPAPPARSGHSPDRRPAGPRHACGSCYWRPSCPTPP